MQKFELVLKNSKVKTYILFFQLFIFLNLAFFIVLTFSSADRSVIKKTVFCLAVAAIAYISEYYARKNAREYNAKIATALFIILTYITLKFWIPAVAVIVVTIFYSFSKKQKIVYVNSLEIIFPSFPKKKIQWKDLNNMILKDDLVTIDFKNNKLIQAEVANGENDYDVDEKEFNDFCKEQLRAASSN
jgi:hypothetical protein